MGSRVTHFETRLSTLGGWFLIATSLSLFDLRFLIKSQIALGLFYVSNCNTSATISGLSWLVMANFGVLLQQGVNALP